MLLCTHIACGMIFLCIITSTFDGYVMSTLSNYNRKSKSLHPPMFPESPDLIWGKSILWQTEYYRKVWKSGKKNRHRSYAKKNNNKTIQITILNPFVFMWNVRGTISCEWAATVAVIICSMILEVKINLHHLTNRIWEFDNAVVYPICCDCNFHYDLIRLLTTIYFSAKQIKWFILITFPVIFFPRGDANICTWENFY